MRKLFIVILLLLADIAFAKAQVVQQQSTLLKNDTIILSQIKGVRLMANSKQQVQWLTSDHKPHEINSLNELHKIYGPNTYIDPLIDFKTKTLLIFPIRTGGCKPPEFIRTVKIIGNKVIYQMQVISYGNCLDLITKVDAVIVPKINPQKTIEFKYLQKQL